MVKRARVPADPSREFPSARFRLPARARRIAIAALVFANAAFPGATVAAPEDDGGAPRRPHVVVILTDDQGWGDLSLHGNTNVHTPRLDRLAGEGVQLASFYVQPVCSPTRAEFLTGRYHVRGGVRDTSAGGERLDPDERIIAEVFKAAGYRTACFGKWHNGTQPPYHPNSRGFDEFYGFTSGHWGMYFDPVLDHNGRIVRGRGFLADDLTNHAISFLTAPEAKSDAPAFVLLALNTPHSPMQVPEANWTRVATRSLEAGATVPAQENSDHTRAALAMVENIDDNVGRLLDALERQGIADNTIVVFFSDNGPNGHRWNGGMRGIKGSTDEGGVRSPFFLRWPARVPGGRVIEPIAGAVDLLPTLAELAGISLDPERPLDGLSLAPLLLARDVAWPERVLFAHWNGAVSARNQRYRLDTRGALYDLEADPGQRHDLAAAQPAMAAFLRAAVATWRQDVLAGAFDQKRPFPVGVSATIPTHLPARDATVTGGIVRSNRFPNDSYLMRWTRLDDAITWDVDVRPGRYRVHAYYACPEADVGARFVLECGDRRLESTVVEAHDPPLRGAAEDRVPRLESYVKEFRPLEAGVIELPEHRGPLTLKAVEIPGSQVMEFRLLVLTPDGN